jgi:rare lipoprotein A
MVGASEEFRIIERMKRINWLPAVALLGVAGLLSVTDAVAKPRDGWSSLPSAAARGAQSGLASWYGPGFHGRRTASGERFNAGAFTAAHRTLPFGSRVRVVNRANGRSVVVRINDRGPFSRGRIIDLSRASARAIGAGGVVPVALLRH